MNLLNELNRVGIEFSFMNTKCYDAYVEERKRNGMHLEDVYKRYKGKGQRIKQTLNRINFYKSLCDYFAERFFIP